MIPARYSLIRYIPDPARGEQLNIGILAWTERHIVLELDDSAVERVRRENPHLAMDALRGLDEQIRDELAAIDGDPAQAVTAWVAGQRGYPTVATEDRYTTVATDDVEALRETVGRLLSRIVHPRRRTGGRQSDIGSMLERALAPLLLSHRIVREHEFTASRSGVPRQVAYFANSGANTALDLVKLTLKKPDEIMRRADAEAFKIEDIRERNDIDIVVLCAVGGDDTVHDATADAQRIIRSVGASVVTSVDEAADAIRQVV